MRVCDTPLTVEIAAAIACYIQAMSRYIMVEQRTPPEEDDYLVYTFNRFQACRFGLEGVFIDPRTHEQRSIREDITDMLARIADHARELHAVEAMDRVREYITEQAMYKLVALDAMRGRHVTADVMQLQAELCMESNFCSDGTTSDL